MGAHIIGQPNTDADIRAALDAIRRIVRWLRVASRATERAVGVSAAQMFVLSRLASAERAPLSLNELAERTLTHQSSVSVVVTRLVQAGFVRRSQSARDGRRQELRLTSRGIALLHRAPDTAQDRLIRALCKMSRVNRKKLANLLSEFVRLAGIEEPAEMFFEDSPQRGRGSRRGDVFRQAAARQEACPPARTEHSARSGIAPKRTRHARTRN